MNKIQGFKINRITLSGFRIYMDQTSFEMGDFTYISGHNGVGKSSLADAIAFAFSGNTFFGEQAIDRLMNENGHYVNVTLDISELTGQEHTLSRTRKGDKTSLTYDTFTIRQIDIDNLFCEKDLFLSIFNPLYFIECIATDGREFLQKLLPIVNKDEVLSKMTSYEQELLNNINFLSPEAAIKSYREDVSKAEDELLYLEGQIDTLESQRNGSEQQIEELSEELKISKQKLEAIQQKQFDGINIDDLSSKRSMLTDKLSEVNTDAINNEIIRVKSQIAGLQERQYESKYSSHMADLSAQIKGLSAQHATLKARILGLKSGNKCPTCFVAITDQNIVSVKTELQKEFNTILTKGREIVAQQKELAELDNKAKEVFIQFKDDDIIKFNNRLTELEESKAIQNGDDIRQSINGIEQLLQYGNLTADELNELHAFEAQIIGLDIQIATLISIQNGEELVKLMNTKTAFEDTIKTKKSIISALSEFEAKRAELSLSQLVMPNVSIQLYEVIRSTGELKNVFRFTYKGRDYRRLSLSEKVKAGIEVSAMLRRLSSLDYPVFIDNTESIGSIDQSILPSQTIAAKFINNTALSVKFKNMQSELTLPKAS